MLLHWNVEEKLLGFRGCMEYYASVVADQQHRFTLWSAQFLQLSYMSPDAHQISSDPSQSYYAASLPEQGQKYIYLFMPVSVA